MKDLLFIGPFSSKNSSNGGYNRIATNILEILKMLEKENYITLTSIDCSKDFSKISLINKMYDISITITHPDNFLRNVEIFNYYKLNKFSKKNYLHIAWETSPFPNRWLKLGEIFDNFLSTSIFVKKEMDKLFKKEICYQFPFYLEEKYEKYRLNIDTKIEENKFTVLYMGQNTKRKGIEDAIVSFCIFSEGKLDTQMFIKSHILSNKEINIENLIKIISSCNSKELPNIFLINQELTEDMIYDLYRDSSVLLAPSRGEGFGLNFLEVNNVGIPVVYTDWSSIPEICGNKFNNYPIKYNLDVAYGMSHYGYDNTSYYAVPLISNCINNLNKIYEKWRQNKEFLYKECSKNYDILKKEFSFENNLKKYLEIFK